MTNPTRVEVEILKDKWLNDQNANQIWTLEDTEGFEDYYEELKWYVGNVYTQQYDAEQNRKNIKMSQELGCSIAIAEYIRNLETRLGSIEAKLSHCLMNDKWEKAMNPFGSENKEI